MISSSSTMKEIKAFLKTKGCKTSFKNKTEALAFIQNLSWSDNFPWNEDQQIVMNWEKEQQYKQHVVQGTFGSGKSTMMLGIYLTKLNKDPTISPKQMLVCAFNISIKNELKQKIRELGFKEKPQVRTFDSMVYEICAKHEMPNVEKPDYEGRRLFVEKLIRQENHNKKLYDGFHSIRLVLVDEVQDLDQKALDLFQTFFPNARFYFFGDVFQCIQKEPRCSLLWQLLKPQEGRVIHFMKKTPRVPTPILNEIKTALTHHYPEFKNPISDWYSSNPLKETSIRWIPIRHYSQVFDHCKTFLASHPPQDCMVLTFSSAITIKGNMGDLSRFRQYLLKEGIQLNKNYKTMDKTKLFLSTVNSSKGLERKHVFIALTFPLELAFANFSNNLVVNLVSVGLSRCKEDVVFCVPIYEDRFSDVLRLYPRCPTPDKDAGKSVRRLKSEQEGKKIKDYLFRSHSATEIIRQSILPFSTRNLLRSFAKLVPNPFSFPPGNRVKWSMKNEEEASFMGILFEVLITSCWTKKWPPMDTSFMTDVMSNPMFLHCRGGITKQFQKLARSFRMPFETCPTKFWVMYDYTILHILLSQKIRVRISEERKREMYRAWQGLENDIRSLSPSGKLKAQVNLNRPFMTGVADLICEKENEQIIYEIKTCSNSDWKEDAFIQAALYVAMSKKNRSTIRLLNPFRREMFEYKIVLSPSENNKTLEFLDRDLLLWNLNCFLAKYENPSLLKPDKDIDFSNLVVWEGEIGLEWMAPTKTRLAIYSKEEYEKQKIRLISHVEKNISLGEMVDKLEFNKEDLKMIDMENDFVRSVLFSCYLRIE